VTDIARRAARVNRDRHHGDRPARPERRPRNLGDPAHPLVHLTELAPRHSNQDACKVILDDGSISDYPKIRDWKWRQVTIRDCADLFNYIDRNQRINICLIRGAPQATTPEVTRRKKASEEYPDGFDDRPTAWIPLDIDGAPLLSGENWQHDPERAVRSIIARLGEPFHNVSVVYQFTGTHGLQRDPDNKKRWTGRLTNDSLRVRLYCLLDRAIGEEQAVNWLRILKASVPELDDRLGLVVQVIYTRKPNFVRLEGDPIAQRVGFVEGRYERVKVPDDLEQRVRWVQAEGTGQIAEMADHPDLYSAIAAIGTPKPGEQGGAIYPHLLAAARHLVRQNPGRDAVEMFAAFGRSIKERHMGRIARNLIRFNRSKNDLLKYFDDGSIERWIEWLVKNPHAFHRKRLRRAEGHCRPHTRAEANTIFRINLE
jgi:hypothetical protein